MCDYCEGRKTLTDKVFEDGTLFNDTRSLRLELLGDIPLLIAEVTPKYFEMFKTLKKE